MDNIQVVNSIFTQIVKLQQNELLSGSTGSIQYRNNNGNIVGNTSFTYKNVPTVVATGTITYNSNSKVVDGYNTSFKLQLKKGYKLVLSDNTIIGEILTIESNTKLNLLNNALSSGINVGFLTNNFNILSLDGDLLPSKANTYSLGNDEGRDTFSFPHRAG